MVSATHPFLQVLAVRYAGLEFILERYCGSKFLESTVKFTEN